MNLAYFKERFNNTESAYLLARRANSPDLNPYALQAIEEIITERGERLPVLAVKPSVESQRLKETKADKFWRLIHPVVKVFKLKAAAFETHTYTLLELPIGSIALALMLSYYVILPGSVVETEHSENWYVYGLFRLGDLDERQKELIPYKIRLVSRGCIVGGDEYEKDIKNNQRVHESASDDLKQLLGKPKTHNSNG
ncbi:MAG: hypothetical protein WCG12_20280 [Alcaligenaceae bacterium]